MKTDEEEYNAVIDKLNNCFNPKVNVTYERCVLKQAKQDKNESKIDPEFVAIRNALLSDK